MPRQIMPCGRKYEMNSTYVCTPSSATGGPCKGCAEDTRASRDTDARIVSVILLVVLRAFLQPLVRGERQGERGWGSETCLLVPVAGLTVLIGESDPSVVHFESIPSRQRI